MLSSSPTSPPFRFHSVLPHLLPLTLVWINHSSDTGWGKFDHFLFPAPSGPLWNVCVQDCVALVGVRVSKCWQTTLLWVAQQKAE